MVKNALNYFKSLNSSWQTIIFVITVLILFLIIVFQSLSIVQMRHKLYTQEQNVFEAENEVKVLVEKLEKTSTEKYVEEIARDRLGMVRTGELPVVINEVKADDDKKEEVVLDSKDKAGIYLKEWYNELGNWFSGSKSTR